MCMTVTALFLHMNQTTLCAILKALLGVSQFVWIEYYMCLERTKIDLEIWPDLTLTCSPSSGVETKVPPSPIAGVFELHTVSLCLSAASVLCIVSVLQNPGYITAAGSLNRGRTHEWWMQGGECDRKQSPTMLSSKVSSFFFSLCHCITLRSTLLDKIIDFKLWRRSWEEDSQDLYWDH